VLVRLRQEAIQKLEVSFRLFQGRHVTRLFQDRPLDLRNQIEPRFHHPIGDEVIPSRQQQGRYIDLSSHRGRIVVFQRTCDADPGGTLSRGAPPNSISSPNKNAGRRRLTLIPCLYSPRKPSRSAHPATDPTNKNASL